MKWPFSGFVWTRTRLVMLASACFLLGLLLARHGWATNWQYCVASGMIAAVLFHRSRLFWLGILVLSLNLGIARGQLTIRSLQPLLSKLNQKVVLQGSVQDDAGYTTRKQTEFHLEHLQSIQGEARQPLKGRINVRGFPNTKINRGDVVIVKGTLRPTLGNKQGQISFGQITLTGRKVSPLERLRREFFAGVYTALPEPGASLGLGFLVGTRSLLPDELKQALILTGLVHIVAVSGYNLTILVRFTRRALVNYSKYIATAVSLALILGFMAVTGMSPSIFRAAVVSLLSIAAWYYGRPIKPMVILLLSAVITAGLNPGYLWYDIGWYLSFLAFFGILVLAPTVSERIFRDKKPHAFWQLIIETFCAQIMTLPLIMFIFSQASLISFIANMIILPLVPVAMLLTFIAGISGMIIPTLAGWFSWPARILLDFDVRVIVRLSKVPWASKSISMLPWQLASFYGSILFIYLIMKYKNEQLARSSGKP